MKPDVYIEMYDALQGAWRQLTDDVLNLPENAERQAVLLKVWQAINRANAHDGGNT